MATTEHTLKLQAILDSRQVQQELQRLRQMQQTQTGQVSTGNAAQRTTNAPAQATGKLDIQIQGLSKNISALTTAIQRLNSFNTQQSTKAKAGTPAAVVPGSSQLGQSMQQMFAKQVDKTLYNAITRHGRALPERSFENIMRGSIQGGGSLYAARMQRFRDIIGPTTSYNEYLKTVNSPAFQALGKPEPKFDKRMAKFVGGMALQQGVGSIAEYMQMSENQNVSAAGNALQAGAKVGGYALMGASIGGPWGALVGAGLGAIESLFDTFTARAREAQAEIEREWQVEQALKKGTASWRKSVEEYNETTRFTNLIEDFNENKTTAGLLNLTKEQERLTQRRDFVAGRVATYQKMSEQGYLGGSDIKGAEDMSRELKELDGKLKTLKNTIKNYNKALDNVKEADQYSEETRQLFKTGSLADIQARYESIKQLRDVAAATGDIETFSKQNPRMRAYQQRIEMIQEIQSRSATELSRMDESYQNRMRLASYGISGGRGVYSIMMDYARSSVDLRKQYEQQMKEGRLEEAAKTKESWQFAAGERNSLADTLLQVLGNRTADLTNVTSLASIGANMGERNDNFDRQMAVWEDQRNLQREIKNILNEKTFESTYGE